MAHIPNGDIERVANKSQEWSRALVDIRVSYEADIQRATEAIKDAAVAMWKHEAWSKEILEEPELWGVEDLGVDGVTIRLVVKTRPLSQWKVGRELRARIKRALDEAGIEIPAPTSVVWRRDDARPVRGQLNCRVVKRTATAELPCRVCAAVAMVVSRRDGGVAVTGFLGSNWLALSGVVSRTVTRAELDRALASADAGALHDLHPEFAPAWRPRCRASYCRAHWRVIVAGADDHPGWYDATYGVCPDGHERKLDD